MSAGQPQVRKQGPTVPAPSVHEAPQAVHEVLSTPGQSIDPLIGPATASPSGTRPPTTGSLAHELATGLDDRGREARAEAVAERAAADHEWTWPAEVSRVRIHADQHAAESARAVGADAYTVGRHIVFGAGQYAPDTVPGQRLLAHELAHVVQQRQWPLNPSVPIARRPSGGKGPAEPGAAPTAGHPRSDAAASPEAAQEPEWEPVIVTGSRSRLLTAANKLVALLLPASEASRVLIVISTGTYLLAFAGQTLKGRFTLAEHAAQLPAGFFVRKGDHLVQLMQHRTSRDNDWFDLHADSEDRYVNLVREGQDRFSALIGQSSGVLFARAEAVADSGDTESKGDEAGPDRAGAEAAQAEGAGSGEGTEPIIPAWARAQFRSIEGRVRSETRRISEMTRSVARDSATSADDAQVLASLLENEGVPSRVSLGVDGADILLGVVVPLASAAAAAAAGQSVVPNRSVVTERKGALVLTEKQSLELLWSRTQTLARVLYAGQAPSRKASINDLVLGLAEGQAPPEGTVAPKTEPYPSEIVNYGPPIGIAHALQRFSMRIDWTVDGQYGTLAAFGPRRYQWDVIRLNAGRSGPAMTPYQRHSARSEGTKSVLGKGFGAIGKDVKASVEEEAIDPDTAALIVTDTALRSIGTMVRSFVTLAAQPSNEQGIEWEGPGTYVVRCISARPPLAQADAPKNAVVRAASVALLPIRVVSSAEQATELIAPSDMQAAEAELAKQVDSLNTVPQAERAGLESQIAQTRATVARLRQADQTDVTAFLADQDQLTEQQLLILDVLLDLLASHVPPDRWGPLVQPHIPAGLLVRGLTPDQVHAMVVSVYVQLTLQGRAPETVIGELRRSRDQVREQRKAVDDVAEHVRGVLFRPHMSFVSPDDGRSLPLTMMLSERDGSTDSHPRWVLYDLSTPGHHDRYLGASDHSGQAGHVEAIRRAFDEFAGQIPYGRGTIGVRLPEVLTEQYPSLHVPAIMTAKPNQDARSMQRLESLAAAAGAAALVVSGPVGVALGVVGGVAGGVVAAYHMQRRHEGGYLEWDLQTAMDVTAVVGALVAPAGVWAGSVSATSRWVQVAGRIGSSAKIFGYLQMGSQVFVIPISLAQELKAIGDDTSLSPGERSARRALAFLNASRSGLELALGAYHALAEHFEGQPSPRRPSVAEQPTELPSVRQAPAARIAVPEEPPTRSAATGEPPASRTAEPPSGLVGVSPPDVAQLGSAKPEPELAKASGGPPAAAADSAPTPAPAPRADVNPAARAEALDVLQERVGSLNKPVAERVTTVRPEELVARPRSGPEAVALYDRVVHATSGVEVGLFYNPETGEFAVQVGSEFAVSPPGPGWDALVHLHPNPGNVITRRLPAPADVLDAIRSAARTGSHVEYVQSARSDGSLGLARLEITIRPESGEPDILVELPGEPPSKGHTGEPAQRIEAKGVLAYTEAFTNETVGLDPTSAQYEWVRRDLDAYYTALREGRAHGGGERTASGTAQRPPTVRQTLVRGRPDIATRFAEADADFTQNGGKGPSPTATFDAAMAALEAHGMGPKGRAAVMEWFRPGRGQQELSRTRFEAMTEWLQRVVELLGEHPEFATTIRQDRYETDIIALGQDIVNAYGRGRTLGGEELPSTDDQYLIDAMTRLDQALGNYRKTGAQDPIARLLDLLTLRNEVARAAGVLQSRAPEFRATTTVGTSGESGTVPGLQSSPVEVAASGRVSESLARDLPGVGLEEKALLTPSDIGQLKTAPRGLAARLRELLRGYHRAHLIGPGFGSELSEGLMLAPELVNLRAQNKGVEDFIRRAARAGVDVRLEAVARGDRLVVPMERGAPEHIDVLREVHYRITGSVGGGPEVTFEVTITVGKPPNGKPTVSSSIPAGAPGSDVLALFTKPTPTP